jgi:hypothetical protein
MEQRICEFGFPGPLRDRLVDAVLSGARRRPHRCLLIGSEMASSRQLRGSCRRSSTRLASRWRSSRSLGPRWSRWALSMTVWPVRRGSLTRQPLAGGPSTSGSGGRRPSPPGRGKYRCSTTQLPLSWSGFAFRSDSDSSFVAIGSRGSGFCFPARTGRRRSGRRSVRRSPRARCFVRAVTDGHAPSAVVLVLGNNSAAFGRRLGRGARRRNARHRPSAKQHLPGVGAQTSYLRRALLPARRSRSLHSWYRGYAGRHGRAGREAFGVRPGADEEAHVIADTAVVVSRVSHASQNGAAPPRRWRLAEGRGTAASNAAIRRLCGSLALHALRAGEPGHRIGGELLDDFV